MPGQDDNDPEIPMSVRDAFFNEMQDPEVEVLKRLDHKARGATPSIDLVREFHIAMDLPADVPTYVWEEPGPTARTYMVTVNSQLATLADALKKWSGAVKAEGDDPGATMLLRLQLLVEEVGEVADALLTGSQVQLLQELTDVQYVLDGTYLTYGLDVAKNAAMAEVHTANMSKFDAFGRPVIGPSGRVEKGPNYKPPHLLMILEENSRPLVAGDEDESPTRRFATGFPDGEFPTFERPLDSEIQGIVNADLSPLEDRIIKNLDEDKE